MVASFATESAFVRVHGVEGRSALSLLRASASSVIIHRRDRKYEYEQKILCIGVAASSLFCVSLLSSASFRVRLLFQRWCMSRVACTLRPTALVLSLLILITFSFLTISSPLNFFSVSKIIILSRCR